MFAPNNDDHRRARRGTTARRRSTSTSRASRRSTCRARAERRRAEPPRHPHRVRDRRQERQAQPRLPVLPEATKTTRPAERSQRRSRAEPHDPTAEARRPHLPRHRRGSHLDDPALRAGVDEPQPVRSGHHADRARRVDDRPAHLPAQPGPRQELRRVPEPARHQAARRRARRKALARSSRSSRARTKQRVPRGTQVSTPQATEEHTVTFETARDLRRHERRARPLLLATSTRRYSREQPLHRSGAGHGRRRVRGVRAARSASSASSTSSDPRFANTGDASLLRVFLGTPERGGRDLARLLEWEYWDGTRWKELEPAPIEVDRGEVAFLGPLRVRADDGQPHRRPVDARPPRRGARVARGHRDRHDPRARRGRRRGPAARRRRTRTSTTTRSSRSTSARTSTRSARSRRSTASSTSRATSCCRPPTRTSRSRCCSPTRA